MNNKKVLFPILAAALIGTGGLIKADLARAANLTNPQSGLVQYLSQKLNVDQSKIQTAVDEYHSQERTERQKEKTERLTTYLDGLVKQNKISETQKNAILTKHAELQKMHESTDWTSKTPEERRALMEKTRTEMESWAKSQGIDTSYLRFGFGGMGGKGGRGGTMRGDF